jgi:hypothetical protein
LRCVKPRPQTPHEPPRGSRFCAPLSWVNEPSSPPDRKGRSPIQAPSREELASELAERAIESDPDAEPIEYPEDPDDPDLLPDGDEDYPLPDPEDPATAPSEDPLALPHCLSIPVRESIADRDLSAGPYALSVPLPGDPVCVMVPRPRPRVARREPTRSRPRAGT